MPEERKDLNFQVYIQHYLREVLGIQDWALKDSQQPGFAYNEDPPAILLPMSQNTLAGFLGEEFTAKAPKELLCAILIGLLCHECAHGLSGEDHSVKPLILNNLVCDSNDLNVVPGLWPGSIPFTLTLHRVTFGIAIDAVQASAASTPGEGLGILLNLAVNYMRRLRIKVDGQEARSLPSEHLFHDVFEGKLKPLMREARRCSVKNRTKLVRKLSEILKEWWVEEEERMEGNQDEKAGDDEASERGEATAEKETFDGALDQLPDPGMAAQPLKAEDAEEMARDAAIQDSMQQAGELIQEADEHLEREISGNSKGKGGGKGRAPVADYSLKEMGNVNCKPVKVDPVLAASVRAAIQPILFERTYARRAPSFQGTRFSAGTFYTLKTQPEKPKIRKDILRIGRRMDESCVVLCFDKSGSMSGEKEKVARQVCGTLYCALAMISRLNVVILGFDESPHLITARPGLLRKVLQKIRKGLEADGGTNFALAFREALNQARKHKAHRRVIIQLTDGDLDGGPPVEETLEDARREGIDVVCIGVQGCDMKALEEIFGPNAVCAPDVRKLPQAMKQVVVAHAVGVV